MLRDESDTNRPFQMRWLSFVLTDQPVPVFYQIEQEIEHFGLDSQEATLTLEFVESGIQLTIPKPISHAAPKCESGAAPNSGSGAFHSEARNAVARNPLYSFMRDFRNLFSAQCPPINIDAR